jgi:hypothetical protein
VELAVVDVAPGEALEKLAEYREVPAAERTAEDRALALGYQAVARGHAVISLARTIAAGGFHDNGLPKMAVARADAYDCFAWWDGHDVIFAARNERSVNRGALVGRHSVRVTPEGGFRPSERRPGRLWGAGHVVVPIIPPRLRPRPHSFPHCHILWEVEEWTLAAPRDPALLRHVRGDLWAVLATWDLTELERLVLSQRVAGPR